MRFAALQNTWAETVSLLSSHRKGLLPVLFALLLLLVIVFLTLLLIGNGRMQLPEYVAGDIAQADIVVTHDVLVPDASATEAQRVAARNQVRPVYRYDPSVASRMQQKLATFFSRGRDLLSSPVSPPALRSRSARSLRNLPLPVRTQLSAELSSLSSRLPEESTLASLVSEHFSADIEKWASEVLTQAYASYLLDDERSLVPGHATVDVINGTTNEESTVQLNRLLTAMRARDRIRRWTSEGRYPAKVLPLLETLAGALLAPNLSFDLDATQARQAQAESNEDPVLRQLKKGKVIVRQGDEITSELSEQIRALRKAILQPKSAKRAWGMGFLLAVLLSTLSVFLGRVATSQWSYWKLTSLSAVLLVSQTALLKAFWFTGDALSRNFLAAPLNDRSYFLFALPFAFTSMLTTLLAGEHVALTLSVFFSPLAALSVDADFLEFLYVLGLHLVGLLVTRKATQRVGIVMAGFKVGMPAIVLFVAITLLRESPLNLRIGGFGAALSFLAGPISASLVVFGLPLCERIFKVTTEIRLSELANINLPLIRDLTEKAPGTYNHSVAVGTLAAAGAQSISLNPLFVRVACLYHDIGKSLHPEFFVENQKAVNPHDAFSPEESARIVKAHVDDGIRLAKHGGLPPAIVDIIPQHHGTKRLDSFLAKATQLAGDNTSRIREEDFRYLGPKPQSKEAAIIMLADAVEASARAQSDHSQEKLSEVIRKIVSSTMEDGQFSECDLTLGEIDRIVLSFMETLSSFYHTRLAYPGFDLVSPAELASSHKIAKS